MKLRDKINQEFQKQLKLLANKLVLAAISKFFKNENIILTIISNYNTDYLIQHQKIWQNLVKFAEFLKDNS